MSTTARAHKAPDTRGPARKLLTSFGFQILAALVLGILAGLVARQLGATADSPNGLSATLDTIGESYVTLLRAAVVPLIFTAIVASISNLRRVQNAARLAGQTLLWFAITAFIAVSIGIVLGLVIRPGERAGDARGLPQCAGQQGRPCRHRQRLPRPPRLRMDGPDL